jgi:hypothetical protein
MPALKSDLLTYINDLPDTLVMQTLHITTGPVKRAEDEFIKTGLARIVAVVGYAILSDEQVNGRVIFRLDADGTGSPAGECPGCLGVWSAGENTDLQVTLIGTEELRHENSHAAD